MIERSMLSGIAVAGVIVVAICGNISAVHAQAADDAAKIVKSMSEYVSRQKNIAVNFDTDVEVTTPADQKIQFSSSGKVLLSRPDKFRVTRTGGYADVEIVFDGRTVSLLGKNLNKYVQAQAPSSTAQLVERLRDKFGVDLPGADLLAVDGYQQMLTDVTDAKYIGRGVIDGIECEHVAFRTPELDWQLWVEAGPRPIPRKYVITSKNVPGSPQYTLRLRNWQTDVRFKPETFAFRPPPQARQVDIAQMPNLDEVPDGATFGQSGVLNGLGGLGGQQ